MVVFTAVVRVPAEAITIAVLQVRFSPQFMLC